MKFGQRFGNPFGNVDAVAIYVEVDPQVPSERILSWTPEHVTGVVHHVVIDGVQYGAAVAGTSLSGVPQDARDHIEVIETSDQNLDEDAANVAASATDHVRLTWAEVTGATRYEVYRKLGAGDYAEIGRVNAGQATYVFTDGPLLDGVYTWKLTTYDAAGNSVDSDEEAETITAAPEAPADIAVSVNWMMALLTWTASTSADIDHYNIYRSNDEGEIDLSAAPHDTDVASPWAENVAALWGTYAYLVRAEDVAGNEEGNVSQIVVVELEGGRPQLAPNAPVIMLAEAIAGGEIRVEAAYDRTDEAGVATTIKMYVNDGAGGAVDWGTPVGSVALATGPDAQAVTVDSTGLAGATTYVVGVRAQTAAAVDDVNTNTESVTTDAVAPAAPDLTTDIV